MLGHFSVWCRQPPLCLVMPLAKHMTRTSFVCKDNSWIVLVLLILVLWFVTLDNLTMYHIIFNMEHQSDSWSWRSVRHHWPDRWVTLFGSRQNTTNDIPKLVTVVASRTVLNVERSRVRLQTRSFDFKSGFIIVLAVLWRWRPLRL
jgi:hypothetical protein